MQFAHCLDLQAFVIGKETEILRGVFSTGKLFYGEESFLGKFFTRVGWGGGLFPDTI